MSDLTTTEIHEAGGRELLRHAVATLAYRAAKAIRNAPDGFAEMRFISGARSPGEILAHMGDLLDWALSFASGAQRWRAVAPSDWDSDAKRFFGALETLDRRLASDEPLGAAPERIFQGPIADTLTHVGQLTLLRRAAGSPIRGENYAKADITVGQVGAAQPEPRFEFD